MSKHRLEAFSDGVIAIIITVMVLEFKTPQGSDLAALLPLIPVLISYVLSFVFIGIYWNNHHHMFHAVERISGGVLWANLYLLFWLSLIPFVTGWMGENNFPALPVAVYGFVLLMSGFAYYLLTRVLVNLHSADSALVRALGSDTKGLLSLGMYSAAVPLAFVNEWISLGLYFTVALIWFIPEPRIEKTLSE